MILALLEFPDMVSPLIVRENEGSVCRVYVYRAYVWRVYVCRVYVMCVGVPCVCV